MSKNDRTIIAVPILEGDFATLLKAAENVGVPVEMLAATSLRGEINRAAHSEEKDRLQLAALRLASYTHEMHSRYATSHSDTTRGFIRPSGTPWDEMLQSAEDMAAWAREEPLPKRTKREEADG